MRVIILCILSIVAASAQTISLSLGTVEISRRDATAIIWYVNNSGHLAKADTNGDERASGAEVKEWIERLLTTQVNNDDGPLPRIIAEATKRYLEANDGSLAAADQATVDAFKAARQAYFDRFGVYP